MTRRFWKDRVVEKPRTYNIQNNPDGTATLVPAPGVIVETGTPVNASNLNGLEEDLETHKADNVTHGIIMGTDGNIYNAIVGDEFSFTGKSSEIGASPAVSLAVDAQFVYGAINNGVNRNVVKYDKISMKKIATSATYGADIGNIAVDDMYVYVVGSLKKVRKLNKSDLSTVADSPEIDTTLIKDLVEDGEFLYLITYKNIVKMNKSNLSVITQISISPYVGQGITQDATHIYIASNTIMKYRKVDMLLVTESAVINASSVGSMFATDTHIYTSGTSQKILKYNKTNLSLISESSNYGDYTRIVGDDNNIYMGANKRIEKLNTSDFSKISEQYTNNLYSMILDYPYLYVGILGYDIKEVFIETKILGLKGVV